MTWARVDDKLHAHPKADAAGLEAMGLWVLALSYCVDQLTDGHVARERVTRLVGDRKAAARAAGRLVVAGLWEETESGYRFHDWSTYQPSAESVRAERDRKRRNVADHRARRNQADAGDVTGYKAGDLPGRNRVPDPDPDPREISDPKIPPSPPENPPPRPASPPPARRELEHQNPAVKAVLAVLAASPELRQVATVELAEQLAQHCSEHGFTGSQKLATLLASLREAAAKAEVQAAGGEPIGRLPSFLLGCAKRPPRAPVAPRDEPAPTPTAVDPRLEPNGAGWAWDCAKHGNPPSNLPAGTVLKNLKRPA